MRIAHGAMSLLFSRTFVAILFVQCSCVLCFCGGFVATPVFCFHMCSIFLSVIFCCCCFLFLLVVLILLLVSFFFACIPLLVFRLRDSMFVFEPIRCLLLVVFCAGSGMLLSVLVVIAFPSFCQFWRRFFVVIFVCFLFHLHVLLYAFWIES